MPWPRARNPIQKLIVPTNDLGLGELDFSGLQFPEDVPLVIAIQAVQTPSGPRVVQGNRLGNQNFLSPTLAVLQDTATLAAGSSPTFDPSNWATGENWIEVKALGGAPTNIIYTLDQSLDGGATWYKVITMTAITAAGLAYLGIAGGGAPAVAGDVKAAASFLAVPTTLHRISWTFTGGAGPTVTHKIWQIYR